MNNKEFIKTIEKINNILKSNNLALINEFENEFIKLENKKETSSMIIFGNRELIKKSFFLLVLLYGENANLEKFKILINDSNNGKKMILELSKINTGNKDIQVLSENVYEYFMTEYYGGSRIKNGDTYRYCLPTRYLVDKMIITTKINDGKLSVFNIKDNKKIIQDTKNISAETELLISIETGDDIQFEEQAKTINNKILGDNEFDIPMEDLEDDLI